MERLIRDRHGFMGFRTGRTRDANGHHQERAFSSGVRPKKFRGVVVVKGQSGCATLQRVGRQIGSSAFQSSFQMSVAISAISQRAEGAIEIGHVADQRRAIGAERLLQAQIAGLAAEIRRP